MYLYVELWNAKPAWLELSQQQRGEYMTPLGPVIGDLVQQGIEIVGWGENNITDLHPARYQFFAVWKMPDQATVQKFQSVVEEAGWHKYFEQINLVGELSTPDTIIGKHIVLAGAVH